MKFSSTLRDYFAGLASRGLTRGSVGELIALLATGEVEPERCAEIVERDGLNRETWFHKDQLDLVLGYIEYALELGPLGVECQHDISSLKDWLGISEGEFATYRPAEVSAILQKQLEMILADWQIDEAEDIYQVVLQTAFDLGYDQYLAFTRATLERAWSALSELGGSEHAWRSNPVLYARRNALEPLYRLAIAQPRTLGDLY